MKQVVQYDPKRGVGYPYEETMRAAACATSSSEIGEKIQYLWPTMDYMTENGRFGRASSHAYIIFALAEMGLTPWRDCPTLAPDSWEAKTHQRHYH